MVGILLLAVVIPLTTWVAVRNQENRSKAAGDETEETQEITSIDEEAVDGICGEMNGTTVTEIPDNRYACAKGAVNWMDTTAEDGTYNWDCIGKMDGVIANCEVSLEK